MRHYKISLAKNNPLGEAINTAGGNAYITTAGGTAKLALTDATGAALANPIALNYGVMEFWTADSVASVDIYGQAPSGHAFIQKAVKPSGNNEIFVGTGGATTVLVIPFNIADAVAATEKDTGFDLPTNALVIPSIGIGVDVITLESAKTIDFGILSSESGGDADGLAAALSLTTAVTVPANVTITSSVWASSTYGALVSNFVAGTNSDDRGLFNLRPYRCDGTAKSISYTLSSGTTVAAGFLRIPYALPAASM